MNQRKEMAINSSKAPVIHKALEYFVRSWAKEVQRVSSEITIEVDDTKLSDIAEALRKSLAMQPIWLVFAPWCSDGVIAATPDAVVEFVLDGANGRHMTSALSLISGGGFTFDVSDEADGLPVVSVAGWGDCMDVIKSIADLIEGATLFDSRIGMVGKPESGAFS